MRNTVNLTIHDRYNTPNGGIPFCLEGLANWLAKDGLDEVIRQLEQEYVTAETKRELDCLFFLIDGITSLDQEMLKQRIASVQTLLPGTERSNVAYNQNVALVERAIEEWKAAAARVHALLKDWQNWMFQNEQLRLGEISTKTALRVSSQRRFNMFLFTPTLFDTPMRFQKNREFFSQVIGAVTGEIESAHLGNRLPPEFDVREFYSAIKVLETQQEAYELLTTEDADAKRQDDELWNQYYQACNALTRALAQMKDVHLWSLFWLWHPDLMETAAY